jgi:hypothetical protein
MLACTGFGDDALFAHSDRKEGLAEGVVNFVRAGVVEVFPFHHHVQVKLVAEAASFSDWSWATNVFVQVSLELGAKGRIRPGFFELRF